MRILLVLALPAFALCAPQTGDTATGKLLFHCEFVPKQVFSASKTLHLPIYNCKNGATEVWVASKDFASGNDWAESGDVKLSLEDITKFTPGSFHEAQNTPENTFNAVPKKTVTLDTVNVEGCRIVQYIDESGTDLTEGKPVEMPNVGLSTFVKWFKSKLNLS